MDSDKTVNQCLHELRAARSKFLHELKAQGLEERARRTRRVLILLSALCIAMAMSGLVPTKVSQLGIEISSPGEQAVIMRGLAVAIGYFLLSFVTLAYDVDREWRSSVFITFKTYRVQLGNLALALHMSTHRGWRLGYRIQRKLKYDPTEHAALREASLPLVSIAAAAIQHMNDFIFPVLLGVAGILQGALWEAPSCMPTK